MCPAKYFSGLPMLGRGNLVGGPPRRAGARWRRVVSLGRACRRRPQFTRVGRCRRRVTLRPVARARGAVRGGVGDGGWEPAIHGSYVFEFGLGSSHQGHRIGATTCLPSHGVAGGWCRGWGLAQRVGCGGWGWLCACEAMSGAAGGGVRARIGRTPQRFRCVARVRRHRVAQCSSDSPHERARLLLLISAMWPAGRLGRRS